MSTTPPGWMTLTEACAYFRVGRTTGYRLFDSGQWPCTRLPGMAHRRVSPADREAIEAMAVTYVPVEASA